MTTQLSNQIRGLMKTFGLIVPKGTGRVFDGNVRKLVDGNHSLARIILPLLEAWRDIRKRAVDLAHCRHGRVLRRRDRRSRELPNVAVPLALGLG